MEYRDQVSDHEAPGRARITIDPEVRSALEVWAKREKRTIGKQADVMLQEAMIKRAQVDEEIGESGKAPR